MGRQMADIIDLVKHKQEAQNKWLAQVNVILMKRFSITHNDAAWTPAIVSKNYATGLSPANFVEQFSKKFGLME
jgi:hypothetical protein